TSRSPGVVTSGRKAFGALISPFIYGGSFGDPARASPTVARFVDRLIASTDVLTLANFSEALQHHDESAAMPILRDVRTTILCGDRDLLTPLDRSVDIAEVLPDAEFVVVPGAGHMVMLEEPARVSEVLGDLIADGIVEWRDRTRGSDRGRAGRSAASCRSRSRGSGRCPPSPTRTLWAPSSPACSVSATWWCSTAPSAPARPP